jgi:hypothetical protein
MKIKEGNVNEVEEIDIKINQLKKIKENILSNVIKNREKEEKEFIDKKHLIEIDDFNKMINTTYEEYVLNHNILKEKLLEKQEKEKNLLINEFQINIYNENLSNSPKLKELERLKKYYLNKKDFVNANYYDNEIENFIKSEKEKIRIKGQNNLKLKLKNLQKIHDKQINEFEHQFKKKCDKLNIDKKNELLKIIHRQKKELENLKTLYKEEKANLKKPKKNISLFQNISISNNSNLTDI